MTVVNYENALARQAEADEKKRRDEINAWGYQMVLNKYPLFDNQANYNIIVSWCNPITLEGFESLLKQHPKSLSMASREALIEEIIFLSHGDVNTLRNLRARLSTYSLAQLRQKSRDIDFKAEVNTRDAAKKFVASQRDTEIGYKGTGYPKLQSTIVPPGQVQAIPTGQYLRTLAKTELWQFKRMVRLYSSAQIDYWLQN
jgi:hypothetical protein